MAIRSRQPEESSMIIDTGILIFNLMVLNVLWTVCSIPVVTIGASTTALNYTCIKLRRDEGDSILKMFFHSFGQNIRQALVLGTGLLAALILLAAGFIQMLGNVNAGKTWAVLFAILILLVIVFCLTLFVYVFMVLARFDNTLFRTLTNAVYFMAKNPVEAFKVAGIMMFMIIVLPSFLWAYVPYAFPLVIFFDIPVTAYVLAKKFNQLFSEYVPEPD